MAEGWRTGGMAMDDVHGELKEDENTGKGEDR